MTRGMLREGKGYMTPPGSWANEVAYPVTMGEEVGGCEERGVEVGVSDMACCTPATAENREQTTAISFSLSHSLTLPLPWPSPRPSPHPPPFSLTLALILALAFPPLSLPLSRPRPLSVSRSVCLSLSLYTEHHLFLDQPLRVGGLPSVPTGLTTHLLQ